MTARGLKSLPGLRAVGLAITVAGGLGACSSSGDNQFQRLGALTKVSIFGAEEKPPRSKNHAPVTEMITPHLPFSVSSGILYEKLIDGVFV